MCFCTRRRSVRSSANSTEPAAKIPSNTITSVASKLFSICQSPLSAVLGMNLTAHRRDPCPLGFSLVSSQAPAGLVVPIANQICRDLFCFSTRALAKPLRVPSAVISFVVFDLPEWRESRLTVRNWPGFHLHSFARNNCPPSRSASSMTHRSGLRLISSALLR